MHAYIKEEFGFRLIITYLSLTLIYSTLALTCRATTGRSTGAACVCALINDIILASDQLQN